MIRFIKLRCQSCLSSNCDRAPIGSWVTEKEGCVKEVTSLEGDQFYYYIMELLPELRRQSRAGKWNAAGWEEYEEFMQFMYDKPKGEHYK